jgi:flagellin-like hook-associated protein FlgL
MAVIPANISRSSDALRWELLTETLSRRSLDLLRLQRQLSTGERLIVASEDPADGRLVLALQRSLERTEQYLHNVERGHIFLSGADAVLGDVGDLAIEAQALAQQEISTPSDADTRRAAAEAVGAIIDGVLALANRHHGGRFLFAGLAEETPPFDLVGPAVLYRGSEGEAMTTGAAGQTRTISVSGADAFGAWDAMVDDHGDLDPIIALSTRLESLNGGAGVQTGTIVVSDGTNTTTIDLSLAGTIYDVIHMMEAALPATTSV